MEIEVYIVIKLLIYARNIKERGSENLLWQQHLMRTQPPGNMLLNQNISVARSGLFSWSYDELKKMFEHESFCLGGYPKAR